MGTSQPSEAAQMLDLLLEYFADGIYWMRGRYDDGQGRRCLVAALHHLRRKHRIPIAAAIDFIQEAMPRPQVGLIYFNDHGCGSFAELRSVIVKARDLALADPQRQQAAATVERWLLAEIERERAARAAESEHAALGLASLIREEPAAPEVEASSLPRSRSGRAPNDGERPRSTASLRHPLSSAVRDRATSDSSWRRAHSR